MNLLKRFRSQTMPMPAVSSPSSITLSMLSNLGVVHGMDLGRFNACEVWYDYDQDLIQVNLTDRTLPRRWPKGRSEWCYSWDEDAPADGSLCEAHFASVILEMSVDDIRTHLYRVFPLELVS